jgi:hypothetical protein
MGATLPIPALDNVANYPPAMGDAFVKAYLQGLPQWLALPIAAATADAAVLYTVPTGYRLFLHRLLWEVSADFTGGTSSAIGVSSDATGFTTKGDLLGGASGDVLATLVAGIKGGTIGAKFGSNGVVVIPAGKVLRFDRITSAFTAGAGFVHVQASLLPTS